MRNPFFHEWSHAAQPDGYPAKIVWRLGPSARGAVNAIERGEADYTLDPPPADRLHELRTRFASQLKINPTDETIFMGLNTRARPFTDLRVRRRSVTRLTALSWRDCWARTRTPSARCCHLIYPDIGPTAPTRSTPSDAGVWRGPDLVKARAFIAASGTRGTPITIWNQPGFFTDFTPSARYLASLLDRLGFPTRVKPFSVNDTTYLPRLANSRTSPQAYFFTWSPNYPAASEFLGPQFWSCHSFVPGSTSNHNLSEFCDPQFDATVQSALADEAAKSPTAAQLWAKADRQFTDQAPIVDLVTPSQTDLVSRRVGNYQFNPQLGVLLDQLWVH